MSSILLIFAFNQFRKNYFQPNLKFCQTTKYTTSTSVRIQINSKYTFYATASLVKVNRFNWDNQTIETQCTLLDFRKAFDAVDHKLVLNKCYDYAINGSVYDVLALQIQFFSERKQFVSINRIKSKHQKMWSLARPISMTTPFHSVFFLSQIDCTNESKLILVLARCKTVRFTKRNEQKNYSYEMNNKDIELQSVFKYLGLYLDRKQKLKNLIEIVNTKLNKLCGINNLLRKTPNKQQLSQFY